MLESAFKKFKTNQGKAVQHDPHYESTGANTKRKNVRKPLNILDLGDDSLQEIFDLKHVSVLELALIAKTCMKLRSVATDVFVRSHKICNIDVMELKDAVMVDRILTTFGPSILDLRIDFTPYSLGGVNIIDSILRNCSKLQSLTMESYTVPDCPINFSKMRRLFGKLKSLHIEYVRINGWNHASCAVMSQKGNLINLFEDCSSLIRLQVGVCWVLDRVIFESKFSKLEHFQYRDDFGRNVEGLQGFVFRHQNLKTLILDANVEVPHAIESIFVNCKKLQHLELNAYSEESDEKPLTPLGRLQNLKKLKIGWDGNSAVELLKSFHKFTSLRELELDSTPGSWNLIPVIAKIAPLRILKLCYTENMENLNALRDLQQLSELFIEHLQVRQFDFGLVDIIKRLVNLKKLKFYVRAHEQYRISRNVYSQLVNVVQQRPVVGNVYLEIDCPATGDFVDLLCPTVVFKRF